MTLGSDAMDLNEWLKLEGDVCAYLKSLAEPNLSYSGPKQCIPGFPKDSFMSDGCLTDGSNLLAVEVEAGQMHPDTNVGKYWLLQTTHPYRRIVLLHVYTPKYNSYPWRKRLGEFYVEQMPSELAVEYLQLDRRKATDYATVLQEVTDTIDLQVSLLFGDAARPA
jgi:hypothetical protein